MNKFKTIFIFFFCALLLISCSSEEQAEPVAIYTFPLYEWCEDEYDYFRDYSLRVSENLATFEVEKRIFSGGPSPSTNNQGLIGFVEVRAWGGPQYGDSFIEPAVNSLFSKCFPESIISIESKISEQEINELIKSVRPTYNPNTAKYIRISNNEMHIHFVQPGR